MITPLTLLAAFFLGTGAEPSIHLPQEIYFANHLKLEKEAVYVLTQREHKIYKVDRRTGALLSEFGVKGQGPGEWQAPVFFQLHEKKIYVSDGHQYKITVLDTDLNFIRDIKGLETGRFVVADNHIFAVSYNPANSTMIKSLSLDLEEELAFGKPLEPENKYMPAQLGNITLSGELLCYTPRVRFEIRVYSKSGELMETILPPFANPDLTRTCDLDDRDWAGQCLYSVVSRLEADRVNRLYITLYSRKTKTSMSMRYDLKHKTWEGGFPSNWHLDHHSGVVYLLKEDPESGTLHLSPYMGDFKKYPGRKASK